MSFPAIRFWLSGIIGSKQAVGVHRLNIQQSCLSKKERNVGEMKPKTLLGTVKKEIVKNWH